MALLHATAFGSVSALRVPTPLPSGNADTITNSLGPFPNKAARDLIFGAASTGFFTYSAAACGGGTISGPGIGSALERTAVGSIPIVGKLFSSVLGGVSAHHAAAVATEQKTLCQAVPDANQFLLNVDTAIQTGQIDTATAAKALDNGYTSWRQEVSRILKDTGGKCNAACIYEKAFRAAIQKRKQDYTLGVAQSSRGGQGVIGGAVNAINGVLGSLGFGFGSSDGEGTPAAYGALPGTTHVLPISAGVLSQAGLTPARQSTLAGFLLIGGILVSVVLIQHFAYGGKSK